jgi:hypothetical protein
MKMSLFIPAVPRNDCVDESSFKDVGRLSLVWLTGHEQWQDAFRHFEAECAPTLSSVCTVISAL